MQIQHCMHAYIHTTVWHMVQNVYMGGGYPCTISEDKSNLIIRVLNVVSLPPHGERACFDIFVWKGSAQHFCWSLLQVHMYGVKIRVMNNLLATLCLHFTRTFEFYGVTHFYSSRLFLSALGDHIAYLPTWEPWMHTSQVSYFTFGTQITLPSISPCTVASASLSTAFPVRMHQ